MKVKKFVKQIRGMLVQASKDDTLQIIGNVDLMTDREVLSLVERCTTQYLAFRKQLEAEAVEKSTVPNKVQDVRARELLTQVTLPTGYKLKKYATSSPTMSWELTRRGHIIGTIWYIGNGTFATKHARLGVSSGDNVSSLQAAVDVLLSQHNEYIAGKNKRRQQ